MSTRLGLRAHGDHPRFRYFIHCIGAAFVAIHLCGLAAADDEKHRSDGDKKVTDVSFDPIPFDDVPGWGEDDHLAAWKAFLVSCGAVTRSSEASASPGALLKEACELAELYLQTGAKQTRSGARQFFETYFKPNVVRGTDQAGLVTGYYEPLLKGSRVADGRYRVPVYRRPPDLVNVVAEKDRGAKSASFTHLRRDKDGLRPYPTRAEIEQGALKGRGLELLYFEDPVDVFFMQIQGSGRVELPNGEKIRITYDGKNGHPYTSIGRALVEEGLFDAGSVTMLALKKWLRADAKRAQAVMWKNESYIFFRELKGEEAKGAMGADGIMLQAGRSLAVDTEFHTIGTPIFVLVPSLNDATSSGGFSRLMIAHDVGSAIKGPERGDIYFGSGEAAGKLAGRTKHPVKFYVLLPDEDALRKKLTDVTP